MCVEPGDPSGSFSDCSVLGALGRRAVRSAKACITLFSETELLQTACLERMGVTWLRQSQNLPELSSVFLYPQKNQLVICSFVVQLVTS